MAERIAASDRFWAKVDKSDPDGCWLWTGSRQNAYGQFSFEGRGRRAHRVAWVLTHGDWPAEGLVVCHHCDTPLCVRPDHLFVGTQQDNLRDMRAKGRAHTDGGGRAGWRNVNSQGERHYRARLTEGDIRAIRADYAAGMRQIDLAAKYGIGKGHARKIVLRRIWSHIE